MSLDSEYRGQSTADAELGDAMEGHGYGWMLFAGTMLALLGTLNFIEGIAAISKSNFFVSDARFVFGDLKTWGWIITIFGVIQGLAGFGILVRNQLARWVGVAIVALDALAQLLMIGAYPFWTVCLFSINILVLYGLIVYGGRAPRFR
jgi:hypothetical protein